MIFNETEALFSHILTRGVSPKTRQAISMLEPDMLESQFHKDILKAIIELDNFNSSVTMISVHEYVSEKYDFFDIARLAKEVVGTIDVNRSVMQIVNFHNDKLAAAQLEKALYDLKSGKPFDRELLSDSLRKMSDTVAPKAKSKPKSFQEFSEQYIDTLEQRMESPDSFYLDIGLDVDVIKTALVVLGGQPGMGKTALALYINDYIARKNKKALIFSLEMEGCDLFERQVSAYSGVSTTALRRAGASGLQDTEWGMITKSITELQESKIFIDDDPYLSIPILFNKCREFKEQHPDLELITVDYLTLMKMPEASRRDLSVGEATRMMKLLAKELKTPVLLLSQLNREADKAAREPRQSDLRDSGSIEQDADIIIFPYREEVHIPETPNKGLAKIIKAKVRGGTTGQSVLAFRNGNFHAVDAEWQEFEKEEEGKARPKF